MQAIVESMFYNIISIVQAIEGIAKDKVNIPLEIGESNGTSRSYDERK